MRYPVMFSVALLVSGCMSHGPHVSGLPPVRDASGAVVSIDVSGSGRARPAGELLELRDTSLLLVWDGRVVEVTFAEMSRYAVAGRSRHQRPAQGLTVEQREELRLRSRHPWGIAPDLMRRILEQYGQERVFRLDELMPPARSSDDARLQEFVLAARAGTDAYHDRRAAIADGYRRIGPDSPGMGEHWINPGLVTINRLDPARPQILSYVMVADTARLIGVAYALVLRGGEAPAPSPIPCQAWHAHTGTVAEEALSLHSAALNGLDSHHADECGGTHHHHGHDASASAPARLATVHAWIWLDNPDGIFAPDNWLIPYLRMGIEPGPASDTRAGRGLALGAGDARYFTALLRHHAGLSDREADAAWQALDAAGRRAAHGLREQGVEVAADAWAAAWHDIENGVARSRRPAVERVRRALGG